MCACVLPFVRPLRELIFVNSLALTHGQRVRRHSIVFCEGRRSLGLIIIVTRRASLLASPRAASLAALADSRAAARDACSAAFSARSEAFSASYLAASAFSARSKAISASYLAASGESMYSAGKDSAPRLAAVAAAASEWASPMSSRPLNLSESA